MLVVLLLGLLLLREPRFAAVEERFLSWLIPHSQAGGPPVPLTVVEIGQDPLTTPKSAQEPTGSPTPGTDNSGSAVSPLEFALFLQSTLDFQPGVIAFENILRWRERDRDQEQVFLDQAMRVPKLLLAAELGTQTDPDAPVAELRGFPQVSGRRGDLPAFSGFARQPNEDLRLISTAGFINFPEEITSGIRVPMLFQYRGEVIPSFTLQAILLWLRVTPADVKIVLGSHIALPQDRRVPIDADGSLLIDPTAARRARRLSLNELLLAAQQRDSAAADAQKLDLNDQIVLARTPGNPLSPPDLFAAAIATIQANKYLRRVNVLFDCLMLLLVGAVAAALRRVDRTDLLLYGIAFTAAYCLIAIGTLSRWSIWLPGVLPLGAAWIAILIGLVFHDKTKDARGVDISIPPPIA
jgi:hypothetical protein